MKTVKPIVIQELQESLNKFLGKYVLNGQSAQQNFSVNINGEEVSIKFTVEHMGCAVKQVEVSEWI